MFKMLKMIFKKASQLGLGVFEPAMAEVYEPAR